MRIEKCQDEIKIFYVLNLPGLQLDLIDRGRFIAHLRRHSEADVQYIKKALNHEKSKLLHSQKDGHCIQLPAGLTR